MDNRRILYLFLMSLCIVTDTCLGQADRGKSDILEARKAKHHFLYYLGGLQWLSFIILKVKLVLVVITIISATTLALKFLGLFKYSNYVYKSNYPMIEGPPAFQQGSYPFSHDKIQQYRDDWRTGGNIPYNRIHQRSQSRELMNDFLVNFEGIIQPLMNIQNKNCQNSIICQVNALIDDSFNDCRKIYAACDEKRTSDQVASSKRRMKRRIMLR